MKPAPFDYHVPGSVDEAVALLSGFGDDGKVLAGGQSLVPMLALRLAVFANLVDIGRIAGLRGFREGDGAVWVGATTTEAFIESDPGLARTVPLLARATPFIGHFQIRNRGTFGGSLAHADPAAEYPAVALTLDATMEVASGRGRREIPAADFFEGLWTTAMDPDELLVGARFPVWTGRCGFSIQEFARRHGDFAVAGATVALEIDAADRVRRCAVGLIGLGPTPLRAGPLEAQVCGRDPAELEPLDLGHEAVRALDAVPSDLHGSTAYRKRVGTVMVARAWTAAVEEARRG